MKSVARKFGGELADRRRLAGAVDADDEDDEGPLARIDLERARERRQHRFDFGGEDGLHLIGTDIAIKAALADGLGDPQRRAGSEVGADQHVFQVLQRPGIELALGEDVGDAAADRLRRA